MNIDDRTLARAQHQGEAIEDKRIGAPSAKSVAPTKRSWVRRHARLLAIVGGVAVLAVFAFAFVLPRFGGAANQGLIFATATRGDIEASVTALGNLQPKDYVDVGAQVSGQIKAIHVQIGDQVKAGDALIEIDAQVQQARVEADKDNLAALQARLVDSKAQLELKQAQYERQVRLDKEGATSKDELQSAKASLASAKATVDQTQAQIEQQESTLRADEATLGYSNIAAPRDGTIVSLDARVGQTINSVQQAPVLLRIADLAMMTVWTQVSEADVAKLQAGMDAYFTTLGNPNRRYPGKVRQILPTPEAVNNVILYTALFDVPNTDGSLMTQMTAQVYFVTASAKDVLVIPAAALSQAAALRGERGRGARGKAQGERAASGGGGDQQSGREGRRGAGRGSAREMGEGRAVVLVVGAGGAPEPRRIETGVTDRVNVEVKSGLNEGDKVVAGREQPAQSANAQRQGGSPLQSGPPGGRRFR